MTNRRITTTIDLRYQDAAKVGAIVEAVNQMLRNHESIDQQQTLLVYFNQFGDSSLNIMVYCFTKTTVWAEWLAAQQDVFLKIFIYFKTPYCMTVRKPVDFFLSLKLRFHHRNITVD